MAKPDMNPAMAQHRKDKERVLKKAKAERQSQRNEKLARHNPFRIEKQIKQLEHKHKLEPNNWTPSDVTELDNLRDLLVQVKAAREKVGLKSQESQQFDESRRPPLGHERDSIFWDPVFNYKGIAPFGYHYTQFDRDGFDSDDESEMQIPPSVSSIPLPSGPPPKFTPSADSTKKGIPSSTKTQQPARTTYEAAPIVRNLMEEATKLVPVSVLAKQATSKPSTQEQDMPKLEDMAQYASEEEEALFGAGKPERDISEQNKEQDES